jgi:type VI secretion system protein ImpA
MNTGIAHSSLLEPVSAERPCGPDLDAAGDADFMSFLAAMEGKLPQFYYSFDIKSIDFDGALASGTALLERSRDVRVIVLLAKLAILGRDLFGFATWLQGLESLLRDRWDDVNPRGEDGDFLSRMAPLHTLDDNPVVILPLQHVALAQTKREGVVTFRAHLVASGEVRPRENEIVLDVGMIEKTFREADLGELTRVRDALMAIRTALSGIVEISKARAGYEQAVEFKALPATAGRMFDLVQAALVRRDPTAAGVGEAPVEDTDGPAASAAGAAAGALASPAVIVATLSAAAAYFEAMEPSSPAVLLIRQARQLVGKNLFEVMQILVPSYAESARIPVGVEPTFVVPLGALPNGTSDVEAQEAMPDAATRQAALSLLDQVASHYRRTEPSSPIPLLLDRAKSLAARDFLTLLKDILTEDALQSMKNG